jgi:hypothetical protein
MAQNWVAIFDLGGVVIDWNPRYLYHKLFKGDKCNGSHCFPPKVSALSLAAFSEFFPV